MGIFQTILGIILAALGIGKNISDEKKEQDSENKGKIAEIAKEQDVVLKEIQKERRPNSPVPGHDALMQRLREQGSITTPDRGS